MAPLRGYGGGYKLPLVKLVLSLSKEGAGGIILPSAFVVARFIGGEPPQVTIKLRSAEITVQPAIPSRPNWVQRHAGRLMNEATAIPRVFIHLSDFGSYAKVSFTKGSFKSC